MNPTKKEEMKKRNFLTKQLLFFFTASHDFYCSLTNGAGEPGTKGITLQLHTAVAHAYLNVLQRLVTYKRIPK